MNIKGAIFDMDGTLIDSLSFWEHLWHSMGARYLNDPEFWPNEEADRAVRTMIYADAMAYIKEYYGIACSTEEFLDFTRNMLPAFYRDVATVKAGAFALLDHLKSEGIPLCLASATAMKELRYALTCHGLDKYFDTVLSCADIGIGKDRPDIYLTALASMGLKANEVAVFEDSYVAARTAAAAGFQTVGIHDPLSPGQDSLKEITDIYLDAGCTLDTLIPKINR